MSFSELLPHGRKGPEVSCKLAELATQTQTLDQRRVTCNIFTFQVVEQFTTLGNHAQQTTTAVVIFFMLGE